ncbi:MAG: EpsG family protein [Muribaculaceae bacterium]
MPLYWSFYILSLVLLVFAFRSTRPLASPSGAIRYATPKWLVVLPALVLILFVAARDVVLDTYAYIQSFKELPTVWSEMVRYVADVPGPGFYLIGGAFKIYISANHYWWFALVGAASIYFLFRFYSRYSCNYALTFFLFIASTNFTWLLNGARQFLAACIVIGCAHWLVNGTPKQKLAFIALMIGLTTIHSSTWFIIPLVLVCNHAKIFGWLMVLVSLGAAVGTLYMSDILEMASEVMNKSYDLEGIRGSSIPRLFVASVPSILVLCKLKSVKRDASPMMKFAINMSFVGLCFFYAATFSSGILVGRMPIYFTLFNYILIPWLLHKYYPAILTWICVGCYTFFFYYQMCVAWENLGYVSYLLGMNYGG